MTCEELKNKVVNKTVDDSLLICVYKDNPFVVNQYINQISKDKHLTKIYIESLEEIYVDANDFFGVNQDVLYIMNTDKLDCSDSLLQYKNLIIVCKDVSNQDSCSNNIVVFDKLNKEQILEYMQVLCPEISVNNLEWLYDVTAGDIYRINFEMQKLHLFSGNQSYLFNLIKEEQGYSDLNQTTIFNFINAFIRRDKNTLLTTLQNLDIIDVEGTGLVTLLLRNIKNLINIQTNPRATPETTKMSPKQFVVVKKDCGKFTNNQLIDMFEFLTGIDYRLKSGQLELSNDKFVGYIISNMMEIGYETQK